MAPPLQSPLGHTCHSPHRHTAATSPQEALPHLHLPYHTPVSAAELRPWIIHTSLQQSSLVKTKKFYLWL